MLILLTEIQVFYYDLRLEGFGEKQKQKQTNKNKEKLLNERGSSKLEGEPR